MRRTANSAYFCTNAGAAVDAESSAVFANERLIVVVATLRKILTRVVRPGFGSDSFAC